MNEEEKEIRRVIEAVLNKHLYDSELELESWRVTEISNELYSELWEYFKDYN